MVSAYIGDIKNGSTATGQIDRPKPPRPTSETPSESTSNSNVAQRKADVKLRKPDRKPKTELPRIEKNPVHSATGVNDAAKMPPKLTSETVPEVTELDSPIGKTNHKTGTAVGARPTTAASESGLKKGSTAIGQIDRLKPPRPTSETLNTSTSNSNIAQRNAEVKLKKAGQVVDANASSVDAQDALDMFSASDSKVPQVNTDVKLRKLNRKLKTELAKSTLNKTGNLKPSRSVVKRSSAHIAEEAARIESYLSYKDESVVNFVEKIANLKDKNVASKLNKKLGNVDDRLKNGIKKILGKDVTGYENNLKGSAINHIEKSMEKMVSMIAV